MAVLYSKLKEFDVSTTLLPSLIMDARQALLNETFHTSCTMKNRLTESSLLDKTAKELKDAQANYLKCIKETTQFLTCNWQICKKMDEILGCQDSNQSNQEDEQIIKLKDGSLKLTCPLINCNLRTFKLKRHLATVHNDLKSNDIEFAVEVARQMEKNKKETSIVVKDPVVTKVKKYQNTAMVNRKGNYKECILCSKLCVNISDHIANTHKISKSDDKYGSLVRNSQLVPRLYTKTVMGKPKKLEGDELNEAMQKYSGEMKVQEDLLKELKTSREVMNNIKEEMKEAKGEGYEKLKSLYATEEESIVRCGTKILGIIALMLQNGKMHF